MVITRVLEDSPAWNTGLNVNDELIAIDGFRVKSTTPKYFGEKVPGDRIVCTLSRNGILQDIHVTVGFTPTSIESVRQVEEPTDQQKLVFKKWLGLEWAE